MASIYGIRKYNSTFGMSRQDSQGKFVGAFNLKLRVVGASLVDAQKRAGTRPAPTFVNQKSWNKIGTKEEVRSLL